MNEFRVVTTTTEEQIFDGKGKRLEVRTSSETVLVSDVIQKTENETEKIDHQEYINSPKWKAKRQMVLERDNFRCRKCGTGKNLDVHHITYENIGNEPLDDLVTLCRNCHEEVHKYDFENKKFEAEGRSGDFLYCIDYDLSLLFATLSGYKGGDHKLQKLLSKEDLKNLINDLDDFKKTVELSLQNEKYTKYDNSLEEDNKYNFDSLTVSDDDFPEGF